MIKHDKTGGLKRGDNLMLGKVNWSAECLLTNYFNEVVFLEIAITYCVINLLYSS